MAIESKPIVTHSNPFNPELPPITGAIARHELHHLQSHWKWFLLLGVLLVLCGTVAVVFPIVSTVAVMSVLAAIFLIAGVATIVASFVAGKWSGMLVHLLFGLLYIAAAFVITERPGVSLVVITVFIAASFIVAGIFRMLAALMIHFPQWGWSLLNGAITTLIGLIVFRQIEQAQFWVVGLLVGLEMLFAGWTWIMVALAIRDLPEHPAT